MEVGNLYRKNLKRILVEKNHGCGYFTTKEWLPRQNSKTVSVYKNELDTEIIKDLHFICNIHKEN